jgi:hypothetical protein
MADNLLGRAKSLVQSNVKNFTSDLENRVKSTATNFATNALESALGGGTKAILEKLLGGPSSMPVLKTKTAAKVSGTDADWRVRLSLPASFANDVTMKPIIETNGLVFPYTPTILIQHTANYDAMQPIHSNYPFPQYTNSQIEDIVITGDFFCENAKDAQYWASMLHYLRSVTKMSYGQSSNAGAPPPIVHLNGYGDFVFPNVPVVVKNFTVDLPADVDYIKTQIDGDVSISGGTTSVAGFNEGWAPVQSQVSVTVGPIYSRAKTSQFSLDDFVNGEYLGSGQNGGGFV